MGSFEFYFKNIFYSSGSSDKFPDDVAETVEKLLALNCFGGIAVGGMEDGMPVRFINDGALKMMGIEFDELMTDCGGSLLPLIIPPDKDEYLKDGGSLSQRQFHIAKTGGQLLTVKEVRIVKPGADGGKIWISYIREADTELFADADETSALSETDSRQLRHLLKYAKQYQSVVLSKAGVVYHVNFTKDLIEREFSQNQGDLYIPTLSVLGLRTPCSYDEYCRRLEKHFSDVVNSTVYEANSRLRFIKSVESGKPTITAVYRTIDSAGRERWVERIVITAKNNTDEVFGLCYLKDITEMRLQEHNRIHLEKKASSDLLTGLYNHVSGKELACRRLASDDGKRYMLIIFDIDNFKFVNDSYGHQFGDRVLIHVVNSMSRMLNPDDIGIRVGGDEFVVLSRCETDPVETANRLFDEINGEFESYNISISVGAALTDVCGRSYDELFRCADMALYKAKRRGKGKVCFYDPLESSRFEKPSGETAVPLERVAEPAKEINRDGLDSEIFDAFSVTFSRHYIFLTNISTGVTRISKQMAEYFGFDSQYMDDFEERWERCVHPDDLAAYKNSIEALFYGKTNMHSLNYRVKNKVGSYTLCTCRGCIVNDENGNGKYFGGNILNHGLEESIDATTCLSNNFEYLKALSDYINKRVPFSVLKIGIDKFNHINVMYGYEFGNELLRVFADMLDKFFGGRCRIFRLSGIKFALCARYCNMDEVRKIYSEICAMATEKIVINSQKIPLKMYGGAIIADNFENINETLLNSYATYALTESKEKFHGELRFFQNGEERIDIIASVHQSVLNGCENFYMLYQPIVDSKTSKIAGAEALIRWKNNAYGDVSPDKFISWLEEDSCFYDLGNWILRQSLENAAKFREKSPDFVLNVNVSPMQLERPGFRASVMQILHETGFPAENLCMELTERCRRLDATFLKRETEFFHSRGLKIALDDFGTGTASSALLRELPVDEVKVDMSFAQGMDKNPANRTIISSIISCAKTLGLWTCIEGVHSRALLNELRAFDADYFQGYCFSPPLTASELIKLI